MQSKKPLSRKWASFLLLSLAFLPSCSTTIPNTRFCAVAGIMEGGMDCFHTLSDDEDHIEPADIRGFLESQAEIKDAKGKVLQAHHAAAICQPMEDWMAEHTAIEQLCNAINNATGSGCTMQMQQMIQNTSTKMDSIGSLK